MSAKKWLLGLIVLMSMLTGLTSFFMNQYQQQDLSKHFTALRLPADLLIIKRAQTSDFNQEFAPAKLSYLFLP